MEFSRGERHNLLLAGIEIAGEFLRVQDIKNKVTYELKLAEVGQISLSRCIRSLIKGEERFHLKVHKWDLSVIKIPVKDIDQKEMKTALERINNFFYTDS